MNSSPSKPSLISYLVPSDKNRFFLQFAAPEKNGSMEASPFPLLSIASSDPFASIIEASIMTGAHCTLQKVFLLLQKDGYPFAGDALWPITNHDIDQSWQDLFSCLRTQEPPDSLIVLDDQMDDSENLLRWRPLFYCRKRQVFFHPSCPQCGSPLDLCSDDDLLIRVGLQPYFTSLKRYLFCPHCQDTAGNSTFYVSTKDPSDPSHVKDQRDLIKGFGRLRANQANETNNPCPECSNFTACYESGDLALSRIVSVGFYPFFMLLFRAPSLHLLDFLPLLSGATLEEQREVLKAEGQVGRLNCLRQFEGAFSGSTLFFFEKGDRFPLEVLYLKLSLLAELAREVFPSLGKLRYPDLGLSIDRFWVSVAEQNSMLPFFWNFRLRSFGVGSDRAQGPHLPKLPPAYGLYLMGTLWFYVLLANNRHRASMIYREVAAALEGISPEGGAPTHGPIDEPGGLFAPENILWDPECSVFNPAWKTLWSDAVNLGFFLLEKSQGNPSKWSEEAFWDKLDQLRTATRKALFMPDSIKDMPRDESDEAIHKMLGRIHQKWRHAPKEAPPEQERQPADTPPADSDPSDDLVVRETVILSPEEFEKEAATPETIDEGDQEAGKSASQRPDIPVTPQPGRIEEDDLPKTVIVTSDAVRKQAGEKDVEAVDTTGNDVPETVILAPGKIQASPADAVRTGSGTADVLGGPGQDASAKKPVNGPDAKQGEKEEDPDALPETMIFKRDKTDKEQ